MVFAQIVADPSEFPVVHEAAVHRGSTTGIHEVFGSFGSRAARPIPCAADFPNIRCIALEGYSSSLNPPGVIANAVASALSVFGAQTDAPPLSQPRMWQVFQKAVTAKHA